MTFGPFDPDLHPGADNAVNTCLRVQPGEKVAIIVDEACREIGASLADAVRTAGGDPAGYVIEQLAPRPITTVPPAVERALATADVGILAMHPRQGELAARMQIVAIVEARRIRYAHMVGVTRDIMRQGMRADYALVDRLSERLRERMTTARRLTVTSPHGTDLVATFDPALAWIKTSGLISTRYWSNLPAGEVFTTPATVDGVFVCNATVGDYFGPKFGDLAATPMRLRIEGGRLVEAVSERADLQEEFWAYTHTDENSDRVGELAFGTNLGLNRLIGVLLQDEKFPGVHLAFGDPYGSQTGADWKSKTHVDVLTRDCDVWIDDDPVIENGRYLLGRLGL